MKIGINLLPLRPSENGGMEVYFRSLLAALLELDSNNEYYLITAPYNDSSIHCAVKNCRKILLNGKTPVFRKVGQYVKRIIGKQGLSTGSLLYIIDKYRFDLWFCPFLSLDPRPLAIPSIVTIPDIQHEYHPDYFSNQELSLRKAYIQPSCEAATEIITISEYSKQCIVDKCNIDSAKIHVIHLAAGDKYHDPDIDIEAVKLKYCLPERYLFYPANCWPHKNHQMLIMALFLYHRSFNDPIHLVLSGSGMSENQPVRDVIAQYELQEYIHILDYVDSDDMPALYKNAKALVFPSLFEGFGIPLLEAMAAGCPVIASDSTSIPEVAANAAYLFDAKKPQSICDAMRRIIEDEGTRSVLIERGRWRAKQFSYEKVARKHLELFLTASEKKGIVAAVQKKRESISLEGRYSDGWISSRMEFRYQGPKNVRHVRMDLFAGLPIQYPMNITIILNNTKKHRIQIPSAGKYSYEYEFPECKGKSPDCTIEIVPGKCYVPKKLGINDDERSISVMLESLAIIDSDANETQCISTTE